jgi:hypothetical protein
MGEEEVAQGDFHAKDWSWSFEITGPENSIVVPPLHER